MSVSFFCLLDMLGCGAQVNDAGDVVSRGQGFPVRFGGIVLRSFHLASLFQGKI